MSTQKVSGRINMRYVLLNIVILELKTPVHSNFTSIILICKLVHTTNSRRTGIKVEKKRFHFEK